MLSVLSGHRRYAQVTRCVATWLTCLCLVRKIVSEDAVRRGLTKIDGKRGKTVGAPVDQAGRNRPLT